MNYSPLIFIFSPFFFSSVCIFLSSYISWAHTIILFVLMQDQGWIALTCQELTGKWRKMVLPVNWVTQYGPVSVAVEEYVKYYARS